MHTHSRLLAALLALSLPAASQASELVNAEASKFKVTLGGFFYGAAHFDTNAGATRPWLLTATTDADRQAFSVDPYGTRINLGITSQVKEDVQAKGFLEFDWGLTSGTSLVPRLRHAYVSLDAPGAVGVLVGQFWVPNLPITADTYSPNFLSRQGNTWARAPQLTVFRSFGPLKAALTAAQTTAVSGALVKPAAQPHAFAEQALPTGVLQLSYSLNPKSFVSVAGGAGRLVTLSPGTDGTQVTENTGTYYAELGANLVFDALGVGAKVWYGKGGLMLSGVAQAAVLGADGTVEAIPARGGMLSARYTLTPAWAVGAYGGVDNPNDVVAGVVVPTQQNLVVGGNVGFTATPGATLALELMNVATKVGSAAGSQTHGDLRTSLVGRYAF